MLFKWQKLRIDIQGMRTGNIHLKLTGFSILTALLLTLSWWPLGLFPLAWAAFVPLFFIHHIIVQQRLGMMWAFCYGFIAFLLFNIGVTWWVWNASAGGAIMAFILNSLLMNLPFMFLHQIGQRQQNGLKIWPFIWAWLAFEYFHYRWDGTWTWLTLGNVFAHVPWLVQWYEYTGVAGGTFWILWVNKNIFQWIVAYADTDAKVRFRQAFNLVFFKLFTPIFLSAYIYFQHGEQINDKRFAVNVMVVQPNIDPYKEKFNNMPAFDQALKMLRIADEHMDSSVQLVVFPETSLVGNLNEENLQQEETIQLIRQFQQKYPNTYILTGADSYKEFKPGERLSETAREYNPGMFYDAYNSAMFISPYDSIVAVYHKSKLVPGVERLPFSSVLKYVEKYAIDLGGTTGSLGTDKEPSVFKSAPIVSAPIICYESIFGEYVGEYVKKGANLLCIITNDGWWGNTAGYRQHLQYARLRAIETRRFVARSANTGISAFIDDRGNIISKTNWWEPAALKTRVYLNGEKTFYVEHGDWVNVLAIWFTLYFVLTFAWGRPVMINTRWPFGNRG